MMNAGMDVLVFHGRAHAVIRPESEQKTQRAAEFSDRLGICREFNAGEPLFRLLCLNLPVRQPATHRCSITKSECLESRNAA